MRATQSRGTPAVAAALRAAERRKRAELPLTDDGIIVLCRLAERGVDTKDLAYAFGVTPRVARNLVKQHQWKVPLAAAQGIA